MFIIIIIINISRYDINSLGGVVPKEPGAHSMKGQKIG